MLLQAMAGHDPNDPASADRPVPDFRSQLAGAVKGLRIGLVRNFHETDNKVNPAVQKGIDGAVEFFRAGGATVRDVVLPPLQDYQACGFVILITEAFALHEPWMRTRYHDYGELLRERLALGAAMSAADSIQAVRKRRVLCEATATAMADFDILLTTAAPTEAPPIEGMTKWASMEKPGFTIPFNVTGLPAISVCSGFGEGDLPVSIQLVAKPFQEPLLFRAAHAYETGTEWRKRRPALLD